MHENSPHPARSHPGIGPAGAQMLQIQHPHVCSAQTRAEVLGHVRLFHDLDASGIAEVDSMMASRSAPADAVLCRAGDPADALYVLAAGRAKSCTDTTDGHEVIDSLLAPGDIFGGLPALGRRQHEVVAQQRHQRLDAIQQGEDGKAPERHRAVDAPEGRAAGGDACARATHAQGYSGSTSEPA